MSTSARGAAKLSFSRMLISLSLSCLLILTPLCVAGQPQTPSNSAAKTQEPSASPSPTAALKKTEDEKKPDDATRPREPMSTPTFNGLRFRSIGPAFTSGRVVGFAVDPTSASRYYVAVASGGVWKTVNNGTTWTPVFENEGSYSIGAIAVDPKNPSTVWVGTGENNSQRSV